MCVGCIVKGVGLIVTVVSCGVSAKDVDWAAYTKQREGNRMVSVPIGSVCKPCVDISMDIIGHSSAMETR